MVSVKVTDKSSPANFHARASNHQTPQSKLCCIVWNMVWFEIKFLIPNGDAVQLTLLRPTARFVQFNASSDSGIPTTDLPCSRTGASK